MEALHLHFGPGRLGLGLVVDAANQAEFRTHLVGRENDEAPPEKFALELTGEGTKTLAFISYSQAERFEQLEPEAREAIATPMPMLMTTALGAELGRCGDLIVAVAQARPREERAATVFIACENDTGRHYEELKRRLQALGVDCRATMVNRLCPERTPDEEDERRTVVRADPHAEWLIEGEGRAEPLVRLGALDQVDFVADVKPFATRKRWIVNGTHVALALFARAVNQPSIRTAARDPESRAQVEELQDEMIAALPEDWAAVLGDSEAYAREQLVPMCRTEDDTARILRRMRRAELAPFLRDADRKLGEPARHHVAKIGRLAPSFEDVFDNLHRLLMNIDSYADGTCVRKGKAALSLENDDDAVRAYEELMRGIVPVDLGAKRSGQLLQWLRRHHLVVGS